MSYGIGHTISGMDSKCVICGKYVGSYVTIDNFNKCGDRKIEITLDIPFCDGKCRKQVISKKDILIGYVKSIDNLFKIK